MERLTERNNDPIILCPLIKALEDDNAYCQSQNCDCDNCKLGKQLTKLAEYEDAEEQGLLVRLPCKVGEQVYCIEEYEDENDYSCYLFVAICNDFVIVSPRYTHHDNFNEQLEEMCEDSQEWLKTSFVMFPRKNVFLTREEAEAALAEMER